MSEPEYGIRSLETWQYTFEELIALLKDNDFDTIEGTVAVLTIVNGRDDSSVQTLTLCKKVEL